MYIKLKWTNLNTVSVTTKIYRGDTPLDRANLANPIATLTNGETEYTDSNVVRGKTYYYVFETTSSNDRVVSNNFTAVAVPRRGAGSSQLQQGDFNYGYFGSLLSTEFINTNELRGQLGMTIGAVTIVSPVWYKFARNGKVLYVPAGSLASGVSWDSLYANGLVFGIDAPYPANLPSTQRPSNPVNQLKTVTIGADKYIVRLMTGFNDDYSQTIATSTVAEPTDDGPNEWNDLVYPLYTYVPDKQRMANVASLTTNDLRLNNQSSNWIQERLSAANAAVRGANSATRTGVTQRSVVPTGNAGSTVYAWWPVLELVDSVSV